jgi:hypothetical protein
MTYAIAIATGLALFAGSGLARHEGARRVLGTKAPAGCSSRCPSRRSSSPSWRLLRCSGELAQS